ncbi:hypothetical protein [uncultured Paludibaculum sp.]|uniref:hypothetical protein n=1 Tax=uncultured Paludibaculum sp. TaxID=1765020 RepID=UPI002AAA8AFD|nr:hypothetical protein [uncultured Paludibaculum sp.]
MIDANSGRCAEAHSGSAGYRLQLAFCAEASSAQTFHLQEAGSGAVRISPVASSLSAAPASGSPGGVELVPVSQSSPWRLDAAIDR